MNHLMKVLNVQGRKRKGKVSARGLGTNEKEFNFNFGATAMMRRNRMESIRCREADKA